VAKVGDLVTVLDTPRVDTIILDETILNGEPKCESAQCQIHGRGVHPAAFTVRLSCGKQMLACARRVLEYRSAEKAIRCTKCGGKRVHFTSDFGYTLL
jgi:DNA-directed RNA polymerase subunit RPC12/RpoP